MFITVFIYAANLDFTKPLMFLYSTQYAALINFSEALFVWWLFCLVLGRVRANLQIGLM